MLARMISCTLLHPVAAAGSGFRCVCRMHPANTGTRRFMHIGVVDTCVLVLLTLQLLGSCCWWREWPMLCWCPQPTLICTWATTPWLLPFVVVFCCCCCVLHCTHWLCRCAGSRPCCCGAVLCVWWREGGEGTEGERGDQHNLSNNKAMQTKKSAPKRERGKKAVPKWKATRK